MIKPVMSKAELRAQLEAALANYHGPVTYCPPSPRPDAEPEALDLDDDEQPEIARYRSDSAGRGDKALTS